MAESSEKPLLFISHKHKNDDTAKAIHDFLRERSLGAVELFCSSRAEAGPATGDSLKPAICEALARTQALILVYTTDEEDWSFCMYECGLATDPKTPKTRVVVFQCSEDVPKVYSDVLRVNLHDEESVKSFVIAFLTDKNFFSDSGKALAADLNRDGDAIKEISKDFFEKLQAAAPPRKAKPDDQWPAFDAVTFNLPLPAVSDINGAAEYDKKSDILLNEARVHWMDKFAPQLFGMPRAQKGMSLKDLFEKWREENEKSSDDWTAELTKQISRVAEGKFPDVQWSVMDAKARADKYVPFVHYVRKMPEEGCVYCDVYFIPVSIPD